MTPCHLAPAMLLALLAATTAPVRAAGLDVHAGGDAADVGLPAYPGAVKVRKKDDDEGAISFALWGESFGIKLVAVKYHSEGSVEDVAAFYRAALPRYGEVLDCSGNRPHRKTSSASAASSGGEKPLTCGDDTVGAGGRLYKVGTDRDHRVVKVTPATDGTAGTDFQLVLVQAHGVD